MPTFLTKHLSDRETTNFNSEEVLERDNTMKKINPLVEFFSEAERYSNTELRTLYALCYLISTEQGNDIDNFITLANSENNIERSKYISRRVDFKELSYFIFSDRRASHIKPLIRDILRLGSIPVKWSYERKNEDGTSEKRIKIAPVLTYDIDLPDFTELGDLSQDMILNEFMRNGFVDISFGRPFFQNIKDRFTYLPKKLIKMWGKKGSGTELFGLLLNELLYLLNGYRTAAIKTEKRVKKELKDSELPQEEKDKILSDALKKTLTAELKYSTIMSKISEYYIKQRKNAKFENHLKLAMDFFQYDLGLISEWDTKDGAKNGKKIVFVFNLNYEKNTKLLS